MIMKKQSPGDGAPSFSYVWKIAQGIIATALGALMVATFAWVWNMDKDVARMETRLQVAEKALDGLANVPTLLSTMQATQSIQQSTQQGANVSLADRMKNLEQKLEWRDRMAGQQGRR
jgi:hypothetical protein